ncbi:hypothetical protein MKW94_030455 [Papaver nudicaule]|uniref:Phytocyanin domain-containing protein n=1 Tax=Papaver nudicaule TaxID=74823 RepID=A0AA41W178_PAPNU|nr:hypothetical protein [Papaver nudicaule]
MHAMKTSTVSNLAISFFFLIVGLSTISVSANASRNHIVGGDRGWGLAAGSYNIWALHRSFVAGDKLQFKYPPGAHNVVRVGAVGYENCKATTKESRKAMSTGNDKLTLKKGMNYFICGFQGHCTGGMKIKVHAK